MQLVLIEFELLQKVLRPECVPWKGGSCLSSPIRTQRSARISGTKVSVAVALDASSTMQRSNLLLEAGEPGKADARRCCYLRRMKQCLVELICLAARSTRRSSSSGAMCDRSVGASNDSESLKLPASGRYVCL